MTHKGRVSPFGDPRIKACSQLPMAFRSVPRPSSPLGAKASTRCPFLLHTHAHPLRTQRPENRVRTKDIHKPPRGQGNPRTVTAFRQPGPGKQPGPRRRNRNHSGRLHASTPAWRRTDSHPPNAPRGHRTKTATLFLFTISIIRDQKSGTSCDTARAPHTLLVLGSWLLVPGF